MGKKLSVYEIKNIATAMEELNWWGGNHKRNKWSKKIIKQLRKKLRKGA